MRQRFGPAPTHEEYRTRFPGLFAGGEADALLPASIEQGSDTGPVGADGPAPGLPDIPGHDVMRLLGRGDMGAVYLARQRSLGRMVAVKVVRAAGGADPEDLARFRAEAEAVARLQHPNIVQVFETGEWRPGPGAPPLPYFTMEFVPGGSLAARLDGSPRPPAEAARLVETLARATHAAHQAGIIHRDLKPANVLLSAECGVGSAESEETLRTPHSAFRTPKITDFGLAKRLEDTSGQTKTGDVMGTPSYMAPEQALGQARSAGPAADVYALGAILYELVTGRAPFRGESTWDTVQQVLTQEPVPPRRLVPRLPRDLETICLKCLEKQPGRRYPGADGLADDLRRFLAGEPIRARPVGPAMRASKWAKRRPAAAALAALSGLVALGLVAAGVWYNARLHDERKREHDRAEAAERLRAEAQRERDRAEENFRLAFDAVGRMVGQARHGPLANTPHGQEAVRALLEDALQFCQSFLRQKGDDPAVRRYAAMAYRLVGDIRRHLGSHDLAESDYAKAVELHEQLLAEAPAHALYRHDYAGTLTNRAVLRGERGQPDGAAADLRHALDVYRRLAEDFPDRPPYRRDLASAHDNLGAHFSEHRRYDEAEQQFRAALDVFGRLLAERPDDLEVREALARCHANYALVHWHRQRLPAAREHLTEAARIQRGLAEKARAEPHHRARLATTLNTLGLVLAKEGRPGDAEVQSREAIALMRRLVADFPTVPDYQSQLGGWLHNLGERLLERREPAAARRLFEEAVERQRGALRINPRHPGYREFHANHCARLGDTLTELGDHARAAEAAAELAAIGPEVADAVDAAGLLVRCAGLAEADRKLSPADARIRVTEYSDTAMALLREAARRGLRDPDRLRGNETFAPLRGRPDFQKLLADMKAKP